jgi:hypothetical protein
MFESARCSILKAGFFCSLDVLYGGLRKGELYVVFDQKFSFSCKFCLVFGHQNPGSGLDPDRYSA